MPFVSSIGFGVCDVRVSRIFLAAASFQAMNAIVNSGHLSLAIPPWIGVMSTRLPAKAGT